MRLFFLHLFRSIKKRPLQPIILVLTVLLSVAFTASALSLGDAISEENEGKMSSQYGTADLTVTQSGDTHSRFMLAERANSLLGDRGYAVGSFDLLLETEGGERLQAAALDLYTVNGIFPLSFTEYSPVNEDTLGESVFITASLSERLGYKLGDSLTLDVLGTKRSYRVAGISKTPLVNGRDVLIDLRGVMSALSYHSALVAALGADFLPATTLFIDLADGVSASEAVSVLRADSDFSDKSFTDLESIKNSSLTTITLRFVISVAIAMVGLVSAAVTFSCFYILSLKRKGENEAFVSAGACPLLLNLMQYAESLTYLLIGAPLGLLLSVPLSLLFDSLVGFEYARSALTSKNALAAASVSLLAVLITVTLFVLAKERNTAVIKKERIWLPLLIAATLGLILTLTISGTARLIIGVISICLVILLLLLSAPPLFSRISSLLSSRSEGKDSRVPLTYALKNSKNVRVLHNTSRLVALLVAALTATSCMVLASLGFASIHEGALVGDCAVINPTERFYMELSEDNSQSIVRVYQRSASFDNGQTVIVLSADSKDIFSDAMDIESLPTENGAVLSSASAKMLSTKVGDEVSLELDGKRLVLTVTDIARSGLPSIVIDSAYHGLGYNLLIADAPDADGGELLDTLSVAAAAEMSAVITIDELLLSRVELIEIYLVAGYIIAAALFVFTLIGLANNLYESYRERRRDFKLYSLAGADLSTVRRMKLCEVLYTLIFGTLLGALLSVPILLLLNRAAYSLNFEIFLCIRKLFAI